MDLDASGNIAMNSQARASAKRMESTAMSGGVIAPPIDSQSCRSNPRQNGIAPGTSITSRTSVGLLLMTLIAFPMAGQNSVQWTTNYYSVTGATLPEIRRSINEARPWKDRLGTDAMTTWKVNWRFTVNQTASGCFCNSFTTATTIAVTFPKWIEPTNAPGSIKAIWTGYITALGKHEARHGQLGLGAAAELQRKSRECGTLPDCESLKAKINGTCDQVVQDFRRRDKEYDERTRHGATEGAILPGGGRGNRPPRRAVD